MLITIILKMNEWTTFVPNGKKVRIFGRVTFFQASKLPGIRKKIDYIQPTSSSSEDSTSGSSFINISSEIDRVFSANKKGKVSSWLLLICIGLYWHKLNTLNKNLKVKLCFHMTVLLDGTILPIEIILLL